MNHNVKKFDMALTFNIDTRTSGAYGPLVLAPFLSFLYVLSFCLFVFCLIVFVSFCLFVFLSFCLFVFLSFCLFVFLSFCLFSFFPFCLFVDIYFVLVQNMTGMHSNVRNWEVLVINN